MFIEQILLHTYILYICKEDVGLIKWYSTPSPKGVGLMKWYSTPSPKYSPYIFLGLDPSPPPLKAGLFATSLFHMCRTLLTYCRYMCIFICMYIYMYSHIYIYISVYIFTYIYIYTHIYIYLSVCHRQIVFLHNIS